MKQETESCRREEWDFRSQPHPKKQEDDWTKGHRFDFLPEDEVWFCWQYELDRFGPDAPYVLDWRKTAKAQTFDTLLEHYWQTDPDAKTGSSLVAQWFYKIWPEWPEQPYLAIKAKDRSDRRKLTWAKERPRPLPLIRLVDIYKDVAALKQGNKPTRLRYWTNHEIELNEDTWVIRRHKPRETDPIIEIAAFEIDFSRSNPVLTKLFARWLKARREKKGYEQRESRGRASETSRMRSDLIDWGAWRLIDTGMTCKEAAQLTQDLSGKALFEDEATWSRAIKRASAELGEPHRKHRRRPQQT